MGFFRNRLRRLEKAISLEDLDPEIEMYAPKSHLLDRTLDHLWHTRMSLRLFNILPIYARFRQLIATRKPDDDKVMFATSVTKCALQGTSQILENVAFLNERGVLSSRFTSKLTRGHGATPAALYTLAYRIWFVAISCDVILNVRKVQLLWRGGVEEVNSWKTTLSNGGVAVPAKHEVHRLDRFETLLPLAWLPVGWQISSWLEHGHLSLNSFLHGMSCWHAETARTGHLWMVAAQAL